MLNQLPLEFKLLDSATFSGFFAGKNQPLLFALQDFLNPNNTQEFFYLWGKTQVGKTHLLQACCNNAVGVNIQAMYLSLNNILDIASYNSQHNIDNFFDGLDNIPLLCLDDVQLIIANHYLEEKLFYLFNNIRAKKNKLIIAANLPPANLELSLLDLKSRLSWGITYHLQELNEQEKIAALMMRAEQIGLQLSEAVAMFLLARIARSTGQLFAILERLDNASLAAKRKLTVPFVKQVLGL
jgi:DnaA family protein